MREALDRAEGGVLLLDEAYALDSGDSFGQEAIDALVKGLEDRREQLAVILTDYPALVQALVDSKPGLRSCVNRVITFPDHEPKTPWCILLNI